MNFWLAVKTFFARLRFIAILAAIGAAIYYWDTLLAYYDKWLRPAAAVQGTGPDVEFYCSMHPTVIRDHPDKCPLCGMELSKRKKGKKTEGEAWPAGVVSRVQLTPYRVALAGIQTWPVTYQALDKEIRAAGYVEFDERKLARIAAKVTGKSRIDKLLVNYTGQTVKKGEPLALLYSPDLVVTVHNLLDAKKSGNKDLFQMAWDRLHLWGIDDEQIKDIVRTGKPITHLTIRSPIKGHVIDRYKFEGEYVEEGTHLYHIADLSTVWIEAEVYEDEIAFMKEGLAVEATAKALPGRVFKGTLAFIHPHLNAATRTLRVRFDMANPHHDLRPGMYATVKLKVPAAGLEIFQRQFRKAWRRRMMLDGLAHALAAGGGFSTGQGLAPLLETALDYGRLKRGLVPAVPETAVIDTGSRKIVYREAGPDVFEGVEVELGPRSGAFYPVVGGLEAGQRLATAGSFLIDAETRLTGGAASTYFGASGGPQASRTAAAVRPSMTEDEDAQVEAYLAKLSPADRRLAHAQQFCAILENHPLGSMGVPVKIMIQGQPVFLCCNNCRDNAEKDLQRTLEKAQKLPSRSK